MVPVWQMFRRVTVHSCTLDEPHFACCFTFGDIWQDLIIVRNNLRACIPMQVGLHGRQGVFKRRGRSRRLNCRWYGEFLTNTALKPLVAVLYCLQHPPDALLPKGV